MDKFFIFIICLFLAGCSVAVKDQPKKPAISQKRDLTKISDIKAGMTKVQVNELMKDEVIIGYERNDTAPGGVVPITMKNPSRTEVVKVGNKSYEVAYYFIRTVKADGLIANDEVIPLVFDNDRVVGKTWDYLYKLRNKNSP